MSGETVKFMLGEPKKIELIQQPWAQQEKWFYKADGKTKSFYIESKGVVAIEEDK